MLGYSWHTNREQNPVNENVKLMMEEPWWFRSRLKLIICLLEPVYIKFVPVSSNILEKELSNCRTVLDIGCGFNSSIQYYNITYSVGLEMFKPYIKISKEKGLHNDYLLSDIRFMNFKDKTFDAILCFEVLEHLTKEEGFLLLDKMEAWGKKIFITTPNGFISQSAYDNNPSQMHKSGWFVEDFESRGYDVFGMCGWKTLRGDKGLIRSEPAILFSIISAFTQLITYRQPRNAFQLFAIKDVYTFISH